jgi:hypothetical protein
LGGVFGRKKPGSTRRLPSPTVKLLKVVPSRGTLDADNWASSGGSKAWENYQVYYDWLLQQNVFKQKLDAQEAFTNDLIDDINRFDARKVTTMAEAYKGK